MSEEKEREKRGSGRRRRRCFFSRAFDLRRIVERCLSRRWFRGVSRQRQPRDMYLTHATGHLSSGKGTSHRLRAAAGKKLERRLEAAAALRGVDWRSPLHFNRVDLRAACGKISSNQPRFPMRHNELSPSQWRKGPESVRTTP